MSIIKDIAYKTLDVVTLGSGVERHIGGQSIRFPARWSRYYESEYEPETFQFFHENVKPGDTVLDIGGHIGLFAVVTAKLVGPGGKVFSFEPTPFTRSVLQEVVDLNECSGIVEVRAEAVSSKCGNAIFFDTGVTISNANSLVKTSDDCAEIRAALVSVDEFAAERDLKIDCLKIDVEGAEVEVLRGARKTFLTSRPVARLGLHPPQLKQNGQSLGEVWEIVEELNLNVVFDGAKVNKGWFTSQKELFDVNLIPG